MHIALLTDGISPYVTGGMQRHSYHLVKQFLKLGAKVTLVHTVPYATEYPPESEVQSMLEAPEGKLQVLAIPFPKKDAFPGHYVRESYDYSCAIYEALKEEWSQFDFIYAKGYTAWCLLEKKKKGEHIAPVGVKFHGYEMFQKVKGLKTRLEQFMLKPPVVFMNRNADAVFSYGGEITAIIERMGVQPNHIVEIGSGIDNNWLADGPSSKPIRRFLFVGRDERRKGISELTKASAVLINTKAEMHWVGPIFQNNQLGEHHVFHGEIKDANQLKSIVDSCDVLVVPSHSEGMPNVILEAMSRGLAVIATDVGAIPKMVSEANGRLIQARNGKELENALIDFSEMSDEQLTSKKQASLDIIKNNFLWDEVGKQTVDSILRLTHSDRQQ